MSLRVRALARAGAAWPQLELRALTDDIPVPPHDRVTDDRHELTLCSGGWIDSTASRIATYDLRRPVSDEDLIHPYSPGNGTGSALAGP